jgi:hypothetical protein
MATEKISHRVKLDDASKERDLRKLLEAAQDDIAALRASVVLLTAKLDADAGVTDTTYASLCNPPALTFIK